MDPLYSSNPLDQIFALGDSEYSLGDSEEDFFKVCLKEGFSFSASSKDSLEVPLGSTDSTQNLTVCPVTEFSSQLSPFRSLIEGTSDDFITPSFGSLTDFTSSLSVPPPTTPSEIGSFLGVNLETLKVLKSNMQDFTSENIDSDWELIERLNSLFSLYKHDRTAFDKAYTHEYRLILFNELKAAVNRIDNRLHSLKETKNQSLIIHIKIAYFLTLRSFFNMLDITFIHLVDIDLKQINKDVIKKCQYKSLHMKKKPSKIEQMFDSMEKLPGYELLTSNPIYERFNNSISILKKYRLDNKTKLAFPFDFDLADLMNTMFGPSWLKLSSRLGTNTIGSKRKRSDITKAEPTAKKQKQSALQMQLLSQQLMQQQACLYQQQEQIRYQQQLIQQQMMVINQSNFNS